ncbi:Glu-tRNA(Gln) amidotransferase GatDE subunit E, partial [Candidatus Woesearchaeota archaeon]|nr:Glu-tRNA(Gln) amidotransferase GatDE subunit E [Candidatus Woesearchaeota archaeon]
EIATEPDLNTPEMVRDAAAHIGLILRSTRKVRRGLGTIRQDVNVSITEGVRVEIKGAQDLKTIPLLVRNEVARQEGLVALAKILKGKWKAGKVVDVSKECKGARGFVGKLVSSGASVIGVGLPGLLGLLGTELYSGHRVGTELAGYAKANGFGGLIHADEDEKKYGVKFDKILKKLGLKAEDGFVLVVGDSDRAKNALEHVLLPRVVQFWDGVPQEVRKANADGTTSYLRPMPGAARMYPETDIPDIIIDASKVKVPKLLTEQIADFAKKYSLPLELAKEAIEEPLFEELGARFKKINARFIAESIITLPKEIKKREKKSVSEDILAVALPEILERLEKGAIPKGAVYELLVDAAHGKKLDFTRFKKVDAGEVEKVVNAVIKADPKAPIGALMGQAMAKLRGKADGKAVMALLHKKLK